MSWAQAGRGADIVLIHGAVVTLEDRGARGLAGWTGTPWRQATILHAAVLALGLDRPVVVGHSFGSAVAMVYGLPFPAETRGVVALLSIALPELRLEHLLVAPRGAAGGRGL